MKKIITVFILFSTKSLEENLVISLNPSSILKYIDVCLLYPFWTKTLNEPYAQDSSAFFADSKWSMKTSLASQKNISTPDVGLRFSQESYSSLNKKEHLISVFLDFSKAFDTKHNEVVIRKLQKSGSRADYLSLFQSYLSNRFQQV